MIGRSVVDLAMYTHNQQIKGMLPPEILRVNFSYIKISRVSEVACNRLSSPLRVSGDIGDHEC